jgi:MGT family glycosyltransferase
MTLALAASRRNILVLGWEGGGNVPPTIAAIRALVERGHAVRFLGDDCILDEARAVGARATPWRRAPNRADRSPASCFARDWEKKDSTAALLAWGEAIFFGPAAEYAEDVVEEAQREAADLIVCSDLLFGGMVAAEALKAPYALFAANISLFPLPGHPPFGPGFAPARSEEERRRHEEIALMADAMFNQFLPALNAARARFGLAPLSRTFDQARPDRLLLATARAFDFPTTSLPEHVRYIGPILEQPSWIDSSLSFAKTERDPRPLVLVSFSTTFQGQDAALHATLAALRDMPARAIVTLGKSLETHPINAPSNVEIVVGASHDAILEHADAVVTHCGHGTTIRSLRAGVPIVAMPMGRDQNDNAARIEYHGAGLRLEPTAAPGRIAAALQRVLSEPAFAANARQLAKAIAAEGGGPDRFAEEVESLLAVSNGRIRRSEVYCA